MSRRPIGDVAMSNAKRSRRRREKAKAMQDAAPQPADDIAADTASASEPEAIAAAPAGKPDADYPRMLYHPDGGTTIAATPEQHDRLTPDGWGTAPLAVHEQRPVSHHGFLGADNPFARPLPRW